MCVATGVITAIGAIAGGAGAVGSAALQSRAANKAAKTQAEAGDKALAFQREQYQQQRADFNPYAQAGAGAVGRLTTAAGATPAGFRPSGGPPPQLGLPQGPPPGLPPGAQGAPGGAIPPPGMGGPPPGGMPPSGPPGGGMVLMRGPDGSTRPVPQQFVQQAMQHGARVVQGG